MRVILFFAVGGLFAGTSGFADSVPVTTLTPLHPVDGKGTIQYTNDREAVSHFEAAFELKPSNQNASQTLASTRAQYQLNGFGLGNFGGELGAVLSNHWVLGFQFARDAVQVSDGTAGSGAISSSQASLWSGDFFARHCFVFSDGGALCPELGIGENSGYFLESQNTTGLSLTRMTELTANLGAAYRFVLGSPRSSLALGLAYRRGLMSGKNGDATWSSQGAFDFLAKAEFPLNPAFSWTIGLGVTTAKNQFAVPSDHWSQSETQVAGEVGIVFRPPIGVPNRRDSRARPFSR